VVKGYMGELPESTKLPVSEEDRWDLPLTDSDVKFRVGSELVLAWRMNSRRPLIYTSGLPCNRLARVEDSIKGSHRKVMQIPGTLLSANGSGPTQSEGFYNA
jgi:hypothetical protein